MLQFLSQPYPSDFSQVLRWKVTFLFSLFVFLFLLVFQPFGLNTYPGNLWYVTLGYGTACFIVMAVLNIILPQFFPVYFEEENWTTAKELVFTGLNIGCIGIANGVYSAVIGIGLLNLSTLGIYFLYTIAVGIFPVGIFILTKQAQLKNRFEKKSLKLNEALSKKHHSESVFDISIKEGQQISISSENQKENLNLNIADLLFIQAADNYIEVHYLANQKPVKSLIRNSLKQVELDLASYPQFFRCHKSYLVNTSKISSFSGNAQGYKLNFTETETKVPVSRKLNDKIQELFAVHP